MEHLVALITAQLPNLPDTFVRISNLPKNVMYHLLVLPFTYNGITDLTCNYLTNGAPSITIKSYSNPLTLNSLTKNPLCFNSENGSIKASAVNGKIPYSFSLNNKSYSFDSVFYNLKPGQYLLEVKDANNCKDSVSIIIKQPQAIKLKLSVQDADCIPASNGSVIASAKDGIPLYVQL